MRVKLAVAKSNLESLPSDLPIPGDDGACAHLQGQSLPDCSLLATNGESVNVSKLNGWNVIFCYPMTGRPNQPLPADWNHIPGARGCTPQACAFRDEYQEIQAMDANVFGLSTQTSAYQQEAAKRLHLSFALLSDDQYCFSKALNLPMFEVDGQPLIKRLTLITHNQVIQHVFYPVFPPNENAQAVIHWLKHHV